MAPTTVMFLASGVLVVLAYLFSGEATGLLFLILALVVFSIAILRRPKEQAAKRLEDWRASVATWGDGIGPAPGGPPMHIAPAAFPPTLQRSYRSRTEAEARRYRGMDADLLAQRGYYPISESYTPGQWRPVDWLAAVLFGLIWVIFLIAIKPAGTITVTYARGGAPGSFGVPVATAPAGAVAANDVAARLAALEQLRAQGLITEEGLAARRADVLASI